MNYSYLYYFAFSLCSFTGTWWLKSMYEQNIVFSECNCLISILFYILGMGCLFMGVAYDIFEWIDEILSRMDKH